MNEVQRVLSFCCCLAIVPAFLLILPLYLRHHLFADVIYPVAESDIIEIHEGISPLFCESHSLEIQNGTFSAFQLSGTPKMSEKRKHIRLKKSMSLPDDTLEYWGFYLMKGATVQLKVCSRYDGSRLLVVKGERNLQTCGLLNHTKNRVNPHFNKAHKHVKVTFEDVAEFINKYDFEEEQQTKTNDKLNTNKNNNIDAQNDASEQTSSEELILLKKYAEDYIDKHANNSRINKTTITTTVTTTTTTNTIINFIKTDSINDNNNNNNEDTDNKNIIFYSNRNNNNSNINDKDIESPVMNENQLNKSVKKNRQRRHHHRIINNNNNNNNSHRKLTKTDIHNNNNNNNNRNHANNNERIKRNIVYDRKVTHGGNAKNYSKSSASNSVSSFENELLSCYDGQILLAESFRPSLQCTNVKFLEESNRMITTHEVVSDGYYYYIFYSDNDYVQNDIHAVFNIYKPTFQYSRMPETKGCINGTNCTFPISMWSNENVIIEMPTRDGLAHDDEDDQTLIISKCHPRMAIYMIFPISVLVLILTCAFL